MAKRKGNVWGATVVYERKYNRSSIGRNFKTSTMNKHKRQGRTKKQMKYRGQGR